MKRYIVLFAIFITAIFFYPVFAHADKIGYFIDKNPVSDPLSLFILGIGLLAAAGFTRRLVSKQVDRKNKKTGVNKTPAALYSVNS